MGSASLTEKPRPAVGELVAGAGLLTRGMGLIVRRPRMFLLGAIPPAITSVIFTGLLIALKNGIDTQLKARAEAARAPQVPAGSKRVRVTGSSNQMIAGVADSA